MSAADIIITLATGLVAGAYAGLLGVGGGIIMVPSMVILLGVEQQVAQGTSLLVIVVTAVAGTVANARRGLVDVRSARALGLAGMAGAVAGALLALRVLDEETLQRVFAVTLLLIAGRLLWRSRPSGGAGAPPP